MNVSIPLVPVAYRIVIQKGNILLQECITWKNSESDFNNEWRTLQIVKGETK